MYYRKWMEKLDKLDTELTRNQRRKEFGYIYEISGLFMNWNPEHYILNVIYVAFLVGVLAFHFPCLAMTVVKSESLAAKGQCMNFVSLVGIALVVIFFFHKERKTLLTLFTIIADGFYDYGLNLNRTEIFVIEKQFAAIRNGISIVLPAWFMLIGASVMGGRYVNQIFQCDISVHEEYINGVYQNLPLKIWYFYTINSEFVRQISLIFGAICALELALVFGSSTLTIIFLGQSLIIQMKTLIIAIRDIEMRADQHYTSTLGKKPPKDVILRRKDKELMGSYKACLRQAMEHHKIIINCFELLQNLVRYPMGISLVNGAILVGMSCITLIKSLEMFHVMFQVNWSDCSKAVVTDMMIMRIRMAKPLVLFGLSTPLNRATFAMISVHSIINIFRAFEVVVSLKKRSRSKKLEDLQRSQ